MAFPVTLNAKGRVGEPDGTIGRANNVVGRIQSLALKAVGQHRDAAVVFGARDAARQVLTDHQAPARVAAHAVSKVGVAAKHAGLPGGFVVTHDAVVGHIGHQQVATVTKINRPFSPAQARTDLLDRRAVNAVTRKRRVEYFNGRIGVALRRFEIKNRRIERHAALLRVPWCVHLTAFMLMSAVMVAPGTEPAGR